MGVGDPVAAVLIASFNRPGGNVTGISLMALEMMGKRLSYCRSWFLRPR
jgi:ABC-type uncharacterized transport system substrate-binding protein